MLNLLICSTGGKNRNFPEYIYKNYKVSEDNTLVVEVDNYPNPLKIIKIISRLKNYEFDKIYSIGGGSVIDVSKVLSIFLPLKLDAKISDLENYEKYADIDKKLFLAAIPTTCGTGAEVTQFATIWDKSNNKKYSIDHPNMIPTEYLLDGSLLETLPYNNFLYPALDCVSHTLESIWNKNRTEKSLEYSKKSLNILQNEIHNFHESNYKKVNFNDMLLASNFAGKAINLTRTSIAHSISYKYTLDYSVPHGLACSFTLPKLHEFVKNSLKDEIYNKFCEPIDLIIDNLINMNLNNQLEHFTDGNKVLFSSETINLSRSTTFLAEVTPSFINKKIIS